MLKVIGIVSSVQRIDQYLSELTSRNAFFFNFCQFVNRMQRRQANIFGTPPEPLFNLKPCYNSPQQLQEWMNLLILDNEERLKKPSISHAQVCCLMHAQTQKVLAIMGDTYC